MTAIVARPRVGASRISDPDRAFFDWQTDFDDGAGRNNMTDSVTDASLAVYRWVLSRRRISALQLEAEFGLTAAKVSTLLAELVDSKLIRPDTNADGQFYVIGLQDGPAVALPIEAEIDRLRRKMLLLRMMFKRLLSTYYDEDDHVHSSDVIETLRTDAEIQAALATALQECKRELLEVRDRPVSITTDAFDASSRDQELVARGIAVRSLYPHSARSHRATRAYIDQRAAAGVEAQTTSHVIEPMLVLDRAIAIVPDRRGGGEPPAAAIVQNGALVSLLCTWFDAAWEAGRPITSERPDYAAASSGTQALIVQMLATGMKDEMIARRLGVSLRTCRRHVAELMERLGATSRFQAGVHAVQLRMLR